MHDFSVAVKEFLFTYGEFAAWLGGISLFLFLFSLITIPLIVISIPADYFIRPPRPLAERPHPVLRIFLLIIKNCTGAVFLIAGFAMLFIPGQGLLTIFIGLMLMNFPGKRRFELKLICNKQIKRAVSWIRQRAKAAPLLLPE
ncbi:PGPGW domain-containing protein [Marispirochaeta sp.]|uniref:PGPGW domain-containing protein n=1 Tax=Marispirochaeta sp. TaxID=2038653 RepID=UPI0029C6E4D9|nr:PGPGW domain-containing protein [Marispirochaeta sp.]